MRGKEIIYTVRNFLEISMRFIRIFLSILTLAAIACESATPAPASTAPASDPNPPPASTPEPFSTEPAITETLSPTGTMIPAGVIFVDTLEQESYPYLDNGKCSLAEAIIAANAGKPQDSCSAGVPGESVIELAPGEYRFTQRDTSPPQFEWTPSFREVGSALPPVVYPLVIRGNGATLLREEGSEPFRFFELMVNSKLTLENITLQNGDVGEDWGGAIYAMSAVLNLNDARFVNNRSENGGAIYLDLGAVNMSNSEFIGNHSLQNGGGLSGSLSRVNIQSTRFESNTSDGNGGALHVDFVNLAIVGSFFFQNRVTGDGLGSRGGGIYANHVNLSITDSQFYQNEAPAYGGAISVNNPQLAGIDPEDGDPMEPLTQSPMVTDFMTSIPGFQATLEAHPSGIFVEFHEDTQIHNNCFANNLTHFPGDPNWTSGLLGRASVADGNYWGDPSGPGGIGPGSGDQVGKRLTFAPFLTQAPAHCDPTLSEKK